MIIFTAYRKELHDYLRLLGNDVSRLDARVASGEKLTFVCSHHRANGGWRKGLDGTSNTLPGEYLDEHALMVQPNEFYEWHGGERYDEAEKDRSATREFYETQPKKRNSIWPSALKTSAAFLITGGL